MATGPTIPTDPLEILTPDLSRPEPFINKYWGGSMTAVLVATSIAFSNYALRRPVFSSLHYYGLGIGGGWVIGQYFDNKRKDYFAERDAVLRHYIQLHPDDFPVIGMYYYLQDEACKTRLKQHNEMGCMGGESIFKLIRAPDRITEEVC